MVNKPLIRPYFWGRGYVGRGWLTIAIMYVYSRHEMMSNIYIHIRQNSEAEASP